MSADKERRQFHRVEFDHQALLKFGSNILQCRLSDISLKGSLIRVNTTENCSVGDLAELEIELGNPENVITMQVEMVHIEPTTIGVKCVSIGINSIAHLRRIIELNSIDESLLQRELDALSHTD